MYLLVIGMGLAATGAAAETAPLAPPPRWTMNAAVAIKETFDSNVYLQSQTSRANQESLVTTVQPQFTAKWNATPAFNANLAYQPEATWFHSEPSEDFILQRGLVNLSGQVNKTGYDCASTLVFIDGDSVGPTWTTPGGSPATGAATVRDRRDAAVYRTALRVTQDISSWFARPVGTFYLHDFQTEQRSPLTGYQNYVDRSEFTGGLDAGRRLGAVAVWAGYRYGIQNQAQLLQLPVEYDNTFHRVLFGVEGTATSWLKLNLSLGPEFRRYGDKVPAAFGDHDESNFFVDSSLTLTPTPCDSITMLAKRFEQPGSSGASAYEDSIYDLCWRHKFSIAWTAGVSGRAYGTDFLKPVLRDDWIFSQSAFVNWSLNPQLNAELSYTHEAGKTRTPDASAREYERHLVAIGLRYNFGALPQPKPKS